MAVSMAGIELWSDLISRGGSQMTALGELTIEQMREKLAIRIRNYDNALSALKQAIGNSPKLQQAAVAAQEQVYRAREAYANCMGSQYTYSCVVKVLLKGYEEMRKANVIGADKYFHCMAMCDAARSCGSSEATLNAAALREIFDLLKGRFQRPVHRDGSPFTNEEHAADSLADMEANRTGASCPYNKTCACCCEKYKVNGIK